MKKRTRYQWHHHWLTTTYSGDLIPVFCEDVVPGDTWGPGQQSVHIRAGAVDQPAFALLECIVHFFFVPYRIIWPWMGSTETEGWETNYLYAWNDADVAAKVAQHLSGFDSEGHGHGRRFNEPVGPQALGRMRRLEHRRFKSGREGARW